LLIASFAMFVLDELTTAKTQQLAVVNGANKTQTVRDVHGREVNLARGRLRTKIDEANDAVLASAESLVAGESPWLMRGVPFLLGLLVFGLGGNMLARWLAMSAAGSREATTPIDHERRPRYT
jgi:hypothetical protein